MASRPLAQEFPALLVLGEDPAAHHQKMQHSLVQGGMGPGQGHHQGGEEGLEVADGQPAQEVVIVVAQARGQAVGQVGKAVMPGENVLDDIVDV